MLLVMQGLGIHFTLAGSDKSLPSFTLPRKYPHLKVQCSFCFPAAHACLQDAAADVTTVSLLYVPPESDISEHSHSFIISSMNKRISLLRYNLGFNSLSFLGWSLQTFKDAAFWQGIIDALSPWHVKIYLFSLRNIQYTNILTRYII